MTVSDTLMPQQIRALNDLILAERLLRASSENAARGLRELLFNTVMRLDGARMEKIRHQDPHAPGNWTVEQWTDFIKNIPASESWGLAAHIAQPAPEQDQRARELMAEIEAINFKLTSATQQLLSVTNERDRLRTAIAAAVSIGAGNTTAGTPAIANIPEGSIAPWIFLLEDAKKIIKEIPRPCPAIQKAFPGGGRVGGDLQKAFARAYVALYLIGKHRLCSMMEIEALLGGASETSAGSGSLRRVMEDMVKARLLWNETLAMGTPKTSLKMVRFSEKEAALYKELFRDAPLENDWSRLIRLHEGGKLLEHTLAVLTFGAHARKRGYYTCVLPEVEGNARPDLWLARGEERLYVEVELGNKDHETKWQNLAALNAGRAALCTSTLRLRERYVGDCKLDQSGLIKSGYAADLETLVKSKYAEVDPATPLWIDTW